MYDFIRTVLGGSQFPPAFGRNFHGHRALVNTSQWCEFGPKGSVIVATHLYQLTCLR